MSIQDNYGDLNEVMMVNQGVVAVLDVQCDAVVT